MLLLSPGAPAVPVPSGGGGLARDGAGLLRSPGFGGVSEHLRLGGLSIPFRLSGLR